MKKMKKIPKKDYPKLMKSNKSLSMKKAEMAPVATHKNLKKRAVPAYRVH